LLLIESNTALGAASLGTVVNAGGTLDLNTGVTVTGEALTVNGFGVTIGTQRGALELTSAGGAATYAGAITVATDASINTSSGGTLTLSGGINKTGTKLTLGSVTATGGGKIIINTVGIS